jgi:glycosyltransferase involved in cell wall biosynthesis
LTVPAGSGSAPSGKPRPELTLVVPFFNPGPTVRRTVERAAAALGQEGISFQIIAVSDGSTDDSVASLAGVLPGQLETVPLALNRGKGFAVRTGLARATGVFVGFIDADGDIPPEVLPDFVVAARNTGADICFGSKSHPQAHVEVPPVRRLSSWAYRWVVRVLFQLSVRDTQTGVKIMRDEVARAVLPHLVEDRFVLDVELFVVAQRLGYRHFVELPIPMNGRYRSTVSARSALVIMADTLKVFWRLKVLSRQPSDDGSQGRFA